MSFEFRIGRNLRSIAGVAIGAVLLVEAGVIAWVYGYERASLRSTEKEFHSFKAARPDPSHDWRQLNSPGIVQPAFVRADESVLKPEEPVIGVEVGGKARAYRLGALVDRDHHLVNDLIGGVPVSVSYCDLTDCVRVYTDRRGKQPLKVVVAGLYDGEMIVSLEGTRFYHKSGIPFRGAGPPPSLPYEQLTPTRTTWGEWKTRHPDTEVYEGIGPEGAP